MIRDSVIADISNSEAFESDNNASGTTATPKTTAIFSNITAIGPRATLKMLEIHYSVPVHRSEEILYFHF